MSIKRDRHEKCLKQTQDYSKIKKSMKTDSSRYSRRKTKEEIHMMVGEYMYDDYDSGSDYYYDDEADYSDYMSGEDMYDDDYYDDEDDEDEYDDFGDASFYDPDDYVDWDRPY